MTADTQCVENQLRHCSRWTPDVDDLATVAERTSVGPHSEHIRLIDPDTEIDPDEAGSPARALLADYIAREGRKDDERTTEVR